MRLWGLPVLLVLAPSVAHAGWYLRQVDKTPGANDETLSELYYEDGSVRIDQGNEVSVIYDLRSGRMTTLSHAERTFTVQTVEELAQMRDRLVTRLREQLKTAPADLQAELAPRLKALEAGATPPVQPAPTGRQDRVGKFSCEIHTWQSEDSEGTFCLSKELGKEMGPFAKDAALLRRRLTELKLGGAKGPGSLAMLALAGRGFPVRTMVKLTVGGQTIETVSEVAEFRKMSVPTAKLTRPAAYKERSRLEAPGQNP